MWLQVFKYKWLKRRQGSVRFVSLSLAAHERLGPADQVVESLQCVMPKIELYSNVSFDKTYRTFREQQASFERHVQLYVSQL